MVERELLISIEYINILTRNLGANLIIDSVKNEQLYLQLNHHSINM